MQPNDIEKSVTKYIKGSKPAPVDLWDPPFCGDLAIHIDKNARWFYQKSEIKRDRLIKLFANILKKENDKYFLVTPVEKVGITVEDAPFLAINLNIVQKGKIKTIQFTTNVGDKTFLERSDQFHIYFKKFTDEPQPYVTIRSNLLAKIDRKTFYRLVDLCSEDLYEGEHWFGFYSNAIFFPLIRSELIR